MFGFANPEFLFLLLLLPVVAGLYLLARYARKRNLAKYGKEKQVNELMPDVSSKKHVVKLTIILLLIATVVVMLARPRAGSMEKIKGQTRGIEVVIAMDVSNSMNASSTGDNNGISRLQRSKMVMQKLIDQLQNDKVALVVFAGKPLMQMPMTIDGTSAKMFLNSINTNLVSLQGTNIGAAIDLSMKAFSKDKNVSKSIILITDGENFEGDAVESAKEAHSKGIQINVIGIGDKAVPIPLEDGNYMLNDNGDIAMTSFNKEKALEIAKAGGGSLVKGDATDAINILNDELKKLASSNMSQITFSKEDELFPIFAWIALALLITYVLLMNRKNPWLAKKRFFKTKNNTSNGVIAMLILSLVASLSLTGCSKDEDSYIANETTKQERKHIKEGNKLYNDEKYEDAEIEYRKALQANPNSVAANYNLALSLAKQASTNDSTNTQELVKRSDSIFNVVTKMTKDTMLLAMTYHNMGNLRYEHENYEGAIDAYKKSLKIKPSDDDTRYNLRMAQLKLQKQQNDQQNDQQNKDKNNDQNNDQDKKDNKDNQNQDSNKDQKQDQQQDKKDEQSGAPKDGQVKEQPLDERNIQQMLKAAQDKENNTLEKINKMQQNQQRQERRQTQNKW